MGRGGTGNQFHHVIEPGVFERVLNHEAARIMVHKAEKQANKVYKEADRKRNKFTTPSNGEYFKFTRLLWKVPIADIWGRTGLARRPFRSLLSQVSIVVQAFGF
jgi:hypothetical protein